MRDSKEHCGGLIWSGLMMKVNILTLSGQHGISLEMIVFLSTEN